MSTVESRPQEATSPEVNIIIINWNGWRDTVECLESLMNLRYDKFRIVVVDNASTNDSIERISEWFLVSEGARVIGAKFRAERFFSEGMFPVADNHGDSDKNGPTISLLKSSSNLGFAAGNNAAIEYVTREHHPPFVLLLNNDTVVHPDFLSELIRIAQKIPEAGILGPVIYWYDDRDRIQCCGGRCNMWLGRRVPLSVNGADIGIKNPIDVQYLSGAALLIRTSILERVGLLDPQYFMYTEDVDFCYRATLNGGRALLVTTSTIWHKLSSSSGGSSSPFVDQQIYRNAIRFMQKNARWYHWPTFLLFSSIIATLRIVRMLPRNPTRAKAMMNGIILGLLQGREMQ